MNVENMRRLYGYNRWANDQILTAAGNLTPEQFTAPDDTPFGSVRNELVHILDVQRGWRLDWELALYGKATEAADLDVRAYPDYESVRALWRDVEARTEAFVESVTADQLAGVVTVEFDWGTVSAPLWEMMVHVVNHGTQHRSEVAMKLTNFGHSPGMVDLLFYSAMHVAPDESHAV